jgi:hypothetical protein
MPLGQCASGVTLSGDLMADETPKWYAEGIAHLADQQQYALAKQLLQEGLQQHPTSFLLWYNGGVLAEMIGNLQEALSFYQGAQNLRPTHPKTQQALTRVQQLLATPAAAAVPPAPPAPQPLAPSPTPLAPVAPPPPPPPAPVVQPVEEPMEIFRLPGDEDEEEEQVFSLSGNSDDFKLFSLGSSAQDDLEIFRMPGSEDDEDDSGIPMIPLFPDDEEAPLNGLSFTASPPPAPAPTPVQTPAPLAPPDELRELTGFSEPTPVPSLSLPTEPEGETPDPPLTDETNVIDWAGILGTPATVTLETASPSIEAPTDETPSDEASPIDWSAILGAPSASPETPSTVDEPIPDTIDWSNILPSASVSPDEGETLHLSAPPDEAEEPAPQTIDWANILGTPLDTPTGDADAPLELPALATEEEHTDPAMIDWGSLLGTSAVEADAPEQSLEPFHLSTEEAMALPELSLIDSVAPAPISLPPVQGAAPVEIDWNAITPQAPPTPTAAAPSSAAPGTETELPEYLSPPDGFGSSPEMRAEPACEPPTPLLAGMVAEQSVEQIASVVTSPESIDREPDQTVLPELLPAVLPSTTPFTTIELTARRWHTTGQVCQAVSAADFIAMVTFLVMKNGDLFVASIILLALALPATFIGNSLGSLAVKGRRK